MRTVLVVDDDLDLLEMVSIALSKYDLKAACIDRGADLIASIASLNPDIILMDIYLGDADGRELCQQLKTSGQFDQIPVILYSAGHISASSVELSLADAFISKPFDVGTLVKKIGSLTIK